MDWLITIVVGGLVGWLASIVAKTNNQMGCLWNIFVGVLGAALGNWLSRTVFHYTAQDGFSIVGFLIMLGGAVLLILILRLLGVLRRD